MNQLDLQPNSDFESILEINGVPFEATIATIGATIFSDDDDKVLDSFPHCLTKYTLFQCAVQNGKQYKNYNAIKNNLIDHYLDKK